MKFEIRGISPLFCHWQKLTDQYARQLDALRMREPGAEIALAQTRRELDLCGIEVAAQEATRSQQAP